MANGDELMQSDVDYDRMKRNTNLPNGRCIEIDAQMRQPKNIRRKLIGLFHMVKTITAP